MKLGPIEVNWNRARLAESENQTPLERTHPQTQQTPLGLPGTPFFHGFTMDPGEYNPTMEGQSAIRTYEMMRRSDAQVAGTLYVCELPVRMADWGVRPASDSAQDKEIASFVRENLFGGLEYESPSGVKTSQRWDDVLRNALLMLTFGAAAHEEIYAVDQDKVRLAKLAPRPPLTFYRWITDLDGETLLALNQYGYRNADFMSVEIPADRLTVFTFNKEGANFFGRSMLRPAYLHWYVKQQLYRIDAIAGERNGLGVPTIEQGPNSSMEDRQAAQQWVTQLATHEKTGMVLPAGWKFTLEGVQGQTRDIFQTIHHHNVEISRTALAFFMNLGLERGSSGSRALGESHTNFFYVALQATADQIASELSATTVKRLVDFNWENVRRYPVVTVANLQSRQLMQAFQTLAQLAQARIIEPYPELAQFVAQQMGLPQPPAESEMGTPPIASAAR
jgi:hypothetical protein